MVLAATDYQPGSTRVRTRKKPTTPNIEMPAPVKGKFWAALRRGTSYHLASTDQTFARGQVVEVTEATYEHLAKAHDVVSHTDPDVGRVRVLKRKFQFSPSLDENISTEYPDLEN